MVKINFQLIPCTTWISGQLLCENISLSDFHLESDKNLLCGMQQGSFDKPYTIFSDSFLSSGQHFNNCL